VTLEEKKDLVFFSLVVHQKSFQSILVDPGWCSKADKADTRQTTTSRKPHHHAEKASNSARTECLRSPHGSSNTIMSPSFLSEARGKTNTFCELVPQSHGSQPAPKYAATSTSRYAGAKQLIRSFAEDLFQLGSGFGRPDLTLPQRLYHRVLRNAC